MDEVQAGPGNPETCFVHDTGLSDLTEPNNPEICFDQDTGLSDLTLIVEDTKIRVCKAVLSLASPVFQAMLDGNFKEKNLEEIKLPEKITADMVEFLSCFYPNRLHYVTGKNVYKILPLASEYQVDVLLERCHGILVEKVKRDHLKDAKEIFRHLHIAELYKLDRLKDKCILIASEFSIADQRAANEEYPVSDEALSEVKDLAIQRHELHAADDMYIFQKYGNTKTTLSVDIKQEIEGTRYSQDDTEKNRARRLYTKYFSSGDVPLKSALKDTSPFISGLVFPSSLERKAPLTVLSKTEQLKLLPEELKQYLQLEQSDMISNTLSQTN